MSDALATWSAPRLAKFEVALGHALADVEPVALREACRYPLRTGGKRIRPLLCLAAAEAVGGESEQALAAATAIELVHTYSLVHDDLPAMDDDDERRGRPTVHVAFGEAVAILVGDALLTEAFLHVAHQPPLVRELSLAAGARGMVAGQFRDITGLAHDGDSLVLLHRQKTGALIRAAVRMGGMSAGADGAALDRLSRYGELVGLAFQVADDVLDAEQDAGADGPPSFLRLYGREWTVNEARRLAAEAETCARQLPQGEPLAWLARFAVERAH